MDTKTDVKELLAALRKAPPATAAEISTDHGRIRLLDNGLTAYVCDGEEICKFYSEAQALDGRRISTREARLLSWEELAVQEEKGQKGLAVFWQQAGLTLRQEILLWERGELEVRLFLRDEEKETATRYMAPFATPYPDGEGKPLLLSLDQKMLLVPYDNDMWLRYESSVPACGRKSYDVTAIYDEQTLEGMVVGALDFSVWKNAIRWAAHDARSFLAYCGAADEGTHDICPHEPVRGTWVKASPFVIFWTRDIRRGMEHYGDICAKRVPPRPWKSGRVPFGWNSYSALALNLRLSHWEEAGDFMREELPNYCDEDGVTYVNLDGAFGLDEREIAKTIEKLHARGQKAGWYANPCNWFPAGGKMPAEGTDVTMGDLFLKDDQGNLMPAADGTVPMDVTHPDWEKMTRAKLRRLFALGIDYLKIDFLSHGSVEGAHYREGYTGRMALQLAYRIMEEEIDAAGRDIFVSLSIAPLFPYFLGNARRSCCDTFGHHEDVRYVLNASNFAWWTNGRLYRFNDPDHVPLYLSVVDGRPATTEEEARSRYYASVISGTVMMLSDNYGPEGDPEVIRMSRERTKMFADDPKVNALARLGKAFVPVELSDGTTPFYTLCHEGKYYAAVFNFADSLQTLSFAAAKGSLPEKGVYRDLRGGEETAYHGSISVTLKGWDAVLLEIEAR